MFTASKAGYISMQKLYSTIGLNGINEAAEFLGMKCSYNDEYKEFCQLVTGTISELNKKNGTKKFQFNTEMVPAENDRYLGHRKRSESLCSESGDSDQREYQGHTGRTVGGGNT